MPQWRVPLLLFVGSLLLQSAWIIALPPFRGIDEFDHAYRAAEVAHGEWVSSYEPAPHGRGYLVEVPEDLVFAATAECETYPYVGHDNCHPVQKVGSGMVTVASAAARYNPFFYWLVGTVAKPLRGAMALYAMRIVAALLCSAMLALAGRAMVLWNRPRAVLIATFCAMTPMAVYSTALPAPNGIEMVAGLTLWVCLLGLGRANVHDQRHLLLLAAPAAIVLATVRSVGPMWLLMIICTCLGFYRKQALSIVRNNRLTLFIIVAAVGIAAFCGTAWTLTQGTNNPDAEPIGQNLHNPALVALGQIPLWMLQSIAAFPTRNEQAPPPVYAVFALIFLTTAGVAIWRGSSRHRWAFLIACVCTFAIPAILTIAAYRHVGAAWQGRYTLPYSMGIPIIGALVVSTRPLSHRLVAPLLVAAWLAVAAAHAIGVGGVLVSERATSPLSGTAEWAAPPLWLVTLLTVGGLALWALACRGRWPVNSTVSDRPPTGVPLSAEQETIEILSKQSGEEAFRGR